MMYSVFLCQRGPRLWTLGRLLCGLLVPILLLGCVGEEKGSLSPPPASTPQQEREVVQALLEGYRTALLQEDIDRLQELLQPGPIVPQGRALPLQRQEGEALLDTGMFRAAMSEAFRTLIFIGVDIPAEKVQIAADRRSVSFLEVQSVEDPATLEYRTRAFHTTFQLSSEEVDGSVNFHIAAVLRDGPVFQVTTPGQVVAGALARVIVAETTGTFPIRRVEVAVADTVPAQTLRARGAVFHGTFQAALQPPPQPLRIRVEGNDGKEVIFSHRYRLREAGEGVVQQLGVSAQRFFSVAVAPDETVWFGGTAATPGTGIGTIVQVAADGQTILRTEQPRNDQLPPEAVAQIEDITIDQHGRLHFLFVARVGHQEGDNARGVVGNGDVVLDPAYPEVFCQIVNVLAPDYPFIARDLRSGALAPSPTPRAIPAGEADIWLFGSDGGVGRVADTFRQGVCTASGVGVRYEPVFRRENSGLLTNSVPAFVAGADGALWFGTALGLTRFRDGQFTPVLFNRRPVVTENVVTLEQFFQVLAEAIFTARPLTTVAIGSVSFREAFGRTLVKEDLIFSAVEDGQGRLWVGTLGGGLRRIETRAGMPQDTLHLTRNDGLGSNLVLALAVAPDGAIWAATDAGVSHIQGRGDSLSITHFSALDGLALPIRDVAVDAQGIAWLATDGGLFRIILQGGRLEGVVLDTTSRPVDGVDIIVQGTPFRAVTDATGRFVLANLPPGRQRLLIDASPTGRETFAPVERDVVVTTESQTLETIVVAPVEGRQLVRLAGEAQTAVVGTTLPLPLEVAIRDIQGNPVPDAVVTFTILEGNGALASPTVITGADGRAGTAFTVGMTAGSNRVEARTVGAAPVVFTAVGARPAARLRQVSGNNQVIEPGQTLPTPLVVQLEDAIGPRAGEAVMASIVGGEGTFLRQTGIGSLTEVTATTDDQGEARFFLQAGGRQEDIVVEVSVPALPQVAPVQFLIIVGFASPVDIAIAADNHLVLVDVTLKAVLRVDPNTGARTLVSGPGRGGGPLLVAPRSLAVEADGNLVVADNYPDDKGAVLRVNPGTGDRSLVSGSVTDMMQRGNGPQFLVIESIAVEADRHLVVTDDDLTGHARIVRIDSLTGDRTIVSECTDFEFSPLQCVGPRVGNGPPFAFPESLAVESNGSLVLVDAFLDLVVRVDPVTGDRSIVSGCPDRELSTFFACRSLPVGGDGPPLQSAEGLAVEPDGNLVVVDSELGAVVRVHPSTGVRTTIEHSGMGPDLPGLTGIAVEQTGQLVVSDATIDSVVRIDPVSGDRTLISQAPRIGSGPLLALPVDIAVGAGAGSGRLLVVDTDLKAVVQVEPATGNRTVVSGCQDRACTAVTGGGPPWQSPTGIAIEEGGRLVMVDVDLKAVVQVEPSTGNRTVISGCRDRACTAVTGGGPPWQSPAGIAIEADGRLVVVDINRRAVLRVDPTTGTRTIISDAAMGGGPPLQFPVGIAVEANGQLVVVDVNAQAVLRIDPATGARSTISDANTGGGLSFQTPSSLAIEANGQLVVVDVNAQAVLRVDPATGARTLVSHADSATGSPVGNGPPFGFPRGIAIEADGRLVLVDAALGAVLRTEPMSGDRTIISR